jgi:hypothetical protein
MAGVTWHYVLKFIITGRSAHPTLTLASSPVHPGDAAVGKSSLLVRLTGQWCCGYITIFDPCRTRPTISRESRPYSTRIYLFTVSDI